MNFSRFQELVLDRLREGVRNGAWTERGLARRLGVSQPHIHNVLAGARSLTLELADGALGALGLDLLDLVPPEALDEAARRQVLGAAEKGRLRLAAGLLGPFQPWPSLHTALGHVRLAAVPPLDLQRPVLVTLAADPGLPSLDRYLALLDLDSALLTPVHGAWYAFRTSAGGVLRRLSSLAGSWVLEDQLSLWRAPLRAAAMTEEDFRATARARALWVGPDPRTALVIDQEGLLR
jgi:transcriptional regulator with XRE-family HTH domain